MESEETENRMRLALEALCRRFGPAREGRRVVAQKLSMNEQSIYQVISGTRLPSGKRKGVGPSMRASLDLAYPGWLDSKEGVTTAGALHNVEAGPDRTGKVPLISWVAAGHWSDVVDQYAVGDAESWELCALRHGPNTFALRVKGLSMYNPGGYPSFSEGDIIYVDPDRDAIHRSLIVVRLDDEKEATFKRLLIDGERRYIEALNPAWPDRITPINGNATLCGVVIGRLDSFI